MEERIQSMKEFIKLLERTFLTHITRPPVIGIVQEDGSPAEEFLLQLSKRYVTQHVSNTDALRSAARLEPSASRDEQADPLPVFFVLPCVLETNSELVSLLATVEEVTSQTSAGVLCLFQTRPGMQAAQDLFADVISGPVNFIYWTTPQELHRTREPRKQIPSTTTPKQPARKAEVERKSLFRLWSRNEWKVSVMLNFLLALPISLVTGLSVMYLVGWMIILNVVIQWIVSLNVDPEELEALMSKESDDDN